MHAAYNLRHTTDMPDKCPHCGQAFHLEPSFYYGALYVSYGLQVALFTTVSIAIAVLFPEAPTLWYLMGVTTVAIFLFPFIIRLSRSIWIHIFVKYDPSKPSPK